MFLRLVLAWDAHKHLWSKRRMSGLEGLLGSLGPHWRSPVLLWSHPSHGGVVHRVGMLSVELLVERFKVVLWPGVLLLEILLLVLGVINRLVALLWDGLITTAVQTIVNHLI